MKLAVMAVNEQDPGVHTGRFTIVELENPKTMEALAKAAYEDPENFYNENMPWASLEGTEKALEIESVTHVLKALSALAKGKVLEEVKQS